MSARAELLAAICAAPEEDAPRLVYADHLLESADERERQRGELIVAQCAVASLPRNSEAWQRARVREQLLLTLFSDPVEGQAWRVREWARGFPRRLEGTPEHLLRARESLVDQPFLEIALLDGRRPVQPTLGELARLQNAFPRVERIRLKNNEASATLDPKALAHLTKSSATLAWPDDALPNRAIRDALTSLYIADTLVPDPHGGLAPYVNEPLPRLEELEMRSRNPDALMAMSHRPLKKLAWHTEGDARYTPLAKLSRLGQLEALDVDVCFDEDVAAALASAPLTSLTFRRDATQQGLDRFTPPKSLRRLALLFAESARAEISRAHWRLPVADYSALESLELGCFGIDETFASLVFPKLWKLAFVDCRIDPRGLAALSKDLRPAFTRCQFTE